MTSEAATPRQRILHRHRDDPAQAADLAALIEPMVASAKVLAGAIRRAALQGRLGLAGEKNPTGDAQKKLDVLANDVVLREVERAGVVAAVVSEEIREPRTLPGGAARYLLCTDPLDGSSNTDVNGPVGTIFGFYRRSGGGAGAPVAEREFLRRGSDQVAAGYVLYGPATVLVVATGRGVDGFTLEEERGEFVLTHPDMRSPARGHYYSGNLGNQSRWDPNFRKCLDYLTQDDPPSGRPYSLRYTGALVADVHRCLIDGGFYFYPSDSRNRDGKLRLLYECAPLALVVEQAGGGASTGARRILDLEAASIHQRVPLVIGSKEDVALVERFLKEGRPSR